MKKQMFVSSTILLFFVTFAIGCGGGGSKNNGQNNSPTEISGTWNLTATATSGVVGSVAKFHTSIITSPCVVDTQIGTFTVQGPSCFIANKYSGQGSISATGNFIYPVQGLLLGVPSNPIPHGTTSSFDFLFAEADEYGDAAVFDGTGTVTNGVMTGTWECNVNSSVCWGEGGTFSGTKQ